MMMMSDPFGFNSSELGYNLMQAWQLMRNLLEREVMLRTLGWSLWRGELSHFQCYLGRQVTVCLT